MSDITGFNELPDNDARALLESCLAVPRWVDAVTAGRPYTSKVGLWEHARASAADLTEAEVDAAVSRHPRIGERAGSGHDAELSRREQAGVVAGEEPVKDALALGNREYEARFGRVFLIQAAGRSGDDILGELGRRLQNRPELELAEVVAQLAEIAMLRLELLLDDANDQPVAAP